MENLASLSLRDSVDSKLLRDTALQLTLLRLILLDGVMIMPMLESNSRPSLSLKLKISSISLKMLVSQLTVILTATQSRLKKKPRKKILRLLTTSSLMLRPQKLAASKLALKKLKRAIKIFLWILTVMVWKISCNRPTSTLTVILLLDSIWAVRKELQEKSAPSVNLIKESKHMCLVRSVLLVNLVPSVPLTSQDILEDKMVSKQPPLLKDSKLFNLKN